MWLLMRLASATVVRRSRKLPYLLVPSRFESPSTASLHKGVRARGPRMAAALSFAECLERTYSPLQRE